MRPKTGSKKGRLRGPIWCGMAWDRLGRRETEPRI